MEHNLALNDVEVMTLISLLELEQRELPPEIHRTSTAYREELRHRLQTVDALLDKLRALLPAGVRAGEQPGT